MPPRLKTKLGLRQARILLLYPRKHRRICEEVGLRTTIKGLRATPTALILIKEEETIKHRNTLEP